ncbi:MAG TPA: hypothetical protein VFZ10_11430 [Geminicoccaceae bacterium]
MIARRLSSPNSLARWRPPTLGVVDVGEPLCAKRRIAAREPLCGIESSRERLDLAPEERGPPSLLER